MCSVYDRFFERNVVTTVKNSVNHFPIDAVAQVAGKMAEKGLRPLFGFVALMSINLGVVNLLPLPALDGGHFILLIIEALRGKVTIILTTHYMEEAEALSDYIAVMSKGNLVAQGTLDELRAKTGKEKLEDIFVSIVEG